ncbi:TetR/AcrR family transcriptional regulator [Mangrovicoccus algicola]|uniref:CerR family C-terminal domain-containing protein n=1 Tax=Mangrovicoccus algicola TaxID=2771008 RepID=A0A8J6YVV6_9RHOB|nr:TetR family transcriptional regulator [Mangrovicoccus algicola]MBE3638815.1 CerR family C-terminal domain-containing protein [Mangrovicoccus algicola]
MSDARPRKKRTSRSDGDLTRRTILETAGEMFSSAGLAETTNKDIAARAEVDIASINYHFVNRAGLYQAVLTEAHRRIADRSDLERIVGSDLSAQGKLKELLRFLLGGTARELQWPLILLGREILAPTTHFAILQQEEILPKLQLVLPLLSEISGIPADDPVLLRCLPSIAAPCALIALVGRGDSPLAEELNSAPRDALVEQLYCYTVGGLEAVSRWHRGKDTPRGE